MSLRKGEAWIPAGFPIRGHSSFALLTKNKPPWHPSIWRGDKLLEKFLIAGRYSPDDSTSPHRQTTAMESTKLCLWGHAPQRSLALKRFPPGFREPMALALDAGGNSSQVPDWAGRNK